MATKKKQSKVNKNPKQKPETKSDEITKKIEALYAEIKSNPEENIIFLRRNNNKKIFLACMNVQGDAEYMNLMTNFLNGNHPKVSVLTAMVAAENLSSKK